MKKINILSLILAGALIVVISMIIALTEGNYMMLKQITKESPAIISMIKGFGFSIAAMVIIIYDDRLFVKLLFVVLDSAMIFCLQYFEPETWENVGAFIYAPYTGLNLFFIGMIITAELRKFIKTNEIQEIDENNIFELSTTRSELSETRNQLSLVKAKLESMLNAKLVNAKRGRGANKEDNILKIENEIKEFIR